MPEVIGDTIMSGDLPTRSFNSKSLRAESADGKSERTVNDERVGEIELESKAAIPVNVTLPSVADANRSQTATRNSWTESVDLASGDEGGGRHGKTEEKDDGEGDGDGDGVGEEDGDGENLVGFREPKIFSMVTKNGNRFFTKYALFVTALAWLVAGCQISVSFFVAKEPLRFPDCDRLVAERGENDPSVLGCQPHIPLTGAELCSSPYVYKRPGVSLISEFDVPLIECDSRPWRNGTVNVTILFVGILCGSLAGTSLADRIGRRPVMNLGMLLTMLSSLCAVLAPYLFIFQTSRFFMGFAVPMMNIPSLILLTEVTRTRERNKTILVQAGSFVAAAVYVSALSVLIPSWRLLCLLASLPAFLFPYNWLCNRRVLIESPRWLVAKGRMLEAFETYERIGEVNGSPLPPEMDVNEFSRIELEDLRNVKISSAEDLADHMGLMSLQHLACPDSVSKGFKTYPLSIWLLVLTFVWIITALLYYGALVNFQNILRAFIGAIGSSQMLPSIIPGMGDAGAGIPVVGPFANTLPPKAPHNSETGPVPGAAPGAAQNPSPLQPNAPAQNLLEAAGAAAPAGGSFSLQGFAVAPDLGQSPGLISGANPAGVGAVGGVPGAVPPGSPPTVPAGARSPGSVRLLAETPSGGPAGEGAVAPQNARGLQPPLPLPPAPSAGPSAYSVESDASQLEPRWWNFKQYDLGLGERFVNGSENLWQSSNELWRSIDDSPLMGQAKELPQKLYAEANIDRRVQELKSDIAAQFSAEDPLQPYWVRVRYDSLTILFSFALEIPAYVLSMQMANSLRFGRKYTCFLLFCVAGFSFLAGSLTYQTDWTDRQKLRLTLALALLGRSCVAGIFALLYMYSAELMPTSIRTGATGFLSAGARIGCILAPSSAQYLDSLHKGLTLFAFSALCFLASLLILPTIPETRQGFMYDDIDTLELACEDNGYNLKFQRTLFARTAGIFFRLTCCFGRGLSRFFTPNPAYTRRAPDNFDELFSSASLTFEQRGVHWLKRRWANMPRAIRQPSALKRSLRSKAARVRGDAMFDAGTTELSRENSPPRQRNRTRFVALVGESLKSTDKHPDSQETRTSHMDPHGVNAHSLRVHDRLREAKALRHTTPPPAPGYEQTLLSTLSN